ncbi:MAG: restriction endonuclease [Planctomycetes bacterium]|nr:restriction endonuclease [Planctomycetota bacterium]
MSLPSHYVDLVYDALLKSYWTKKGLKRFLRRSHIAESFLAQLSNDETKRDWLDRVFAKLEATERGRILINKMAHALAEQSSFPDLQGWEDSKGKIESATEAVKRIKVYLERKHEEKGREEEARKRREEAEERRSVIRRAKDDLDKLRTLLESLTGQIGTQEGGYAFQPWFYDLMDYSEVDNRRPYVKDGRQIDGSITVDGTTYLVELKFSAKQAGANDVDSLLAKVNTKSDNTMGLMVAISGFSKPAVAQASFAKSPVLLMDHLHLYTVLMGTMEFADVLRRVRRHSSQTGVAYLPPDRFGSG